MPTNITIVQTRDFIRARHDGRLDLDTSRRLLVDVVSAIRTAEDHNVLIDQRAAAPTRLSTKDLWQLGIAAGTHPTLSRARVALLVPLDKKEDTSPGTTLALFHQRSPTSELTVRADLKEEKENGDTKHTTVGEEVTAGSPHIVGLTRRRTTNPRDALSQLSAELLKAESLDGSAVRAALSSAGHDVAS